MPSHRILWTLTIDLWSTTYIEVVRNIIILKCPLMGHVIELQTETCTEMFMAKSPRTNAHLPECAQFCASMRPYAFLIDGRARVPCWRSWIHCWSLAMGVANAAVVATPASSCSVSAPTRHILNVHAAMDRNSQCEACAHVHDRTVHVDHCGTVLLQWLGHESLHFAWAA